jgi:hypothetical protein
MYGIFHVEFIFLHTNSQKTELKKKTELSYKR